MIEESRLEKEQRWNEATMRKMRYGEYDRVGMIIIDLTGNRRGME